MSKPPPLVIIGIIIGIIGLGFAFEWPTVTQGWPVLLFLLCPLMHLLGGHGHGEEHSSSKSHEQDGGSCH